jgi:23S rRNA (cytidine1920-2'-O)/16S rRNA (cytidine1409-2'-O)-methyltransferase
VLAQGGPELASRRRLDVELVSRGLAANRTEAEALVASARVLVAGAVAAKPSRQVSSSEPVVVTNALPRYASRGGEKLDAALADFGVEVAGKHVLDAGASTGGFTDCLLKRGASRVVAVDVGRGQLLARLRVDPRVEVVEGANVRYLRPEALGGRRFPLVVADLSFISLTLVAGALVGLAAAGADLVVLVKPQFEAGRSVVSKGRGVVRNPDVWAEALCKVAAAFEAAGAGVVGAMPSPLRGAEGNREFFLHVRAGSGSGIGPVELGSVARDATAGTAWRG